MPMTHQVASGLIPVYPFNDSSNLPKKVDTVVIGGGIVGVMTALELAQRGISVALCEKGAIAGEQSSRNSGWIRQLQRDERLIPLYTRSLDLWSGMDKRIGRDIGWRRTGIAHLAYNKKDMNLITDYLKIGRRFDLDIRMLNREQIERDIPGGKPRILGALYARNGGRAEPWMAVPEMAEAARKLGVHIAIKCAVRTIETAAGRIFSVISERGEIRCSSVVLAAGVWTRIFMGNHGIDIPQLNEIRTVMHVDGISHLADMPVRSDNFAFRKRMDGSFAVSVSNKEGPSLFQNFTNYPLDLLRDIIARWRDIDLRDNKMHIKNMQAHCKWKVDSLSPFEQTRVMAPVPSESAVRSAFRHLSEAFPDFASARIIGKWAGMLSSSPDGLPVLSQITSTPGLFVATGLSSGGFGAGPAVGELMADLICGKTPAVDPKIYDFSRVIG